MNDAPQPVLGLDVDPAVLLQQQTRGRAGRVAMALAIIGTIVTINALFTAGSQSTYVRIALPTGIILQAIALALGIYARRTKPGKAAIWITLLFYALGLVLVGVGRSLSTSMSR